MPSYTADSQVTLMSGSCTLYSAENVFSISFTISITFELIAEGIVTQTSHSLVMTLSLVPPSILRICNGHTPLMASSTLPINKWAFPRS